MYYESFHKFFPEVATKETEIIIISENSSSSIPPGEYLLVESYCATPKCDCRRTFLNIFTKDGYQLLAVISYGWESRKFYVKWFGADDRETIDDLKGPALPVGQPQSELAPELLKLVTVLVLSDPVYILRLKKHYQMFKSFIAKPVSQRHRSLQS